MKKVLIVEDDKEINRLIREYLSANDYRTVSAENGLDAIHIIHADQDLSLVILDLMLPLKSGDRVLQEIREFSDIPVIIVSARSMVQSKIDLMRMGADDYITKPFDLDELLVRIEAVLRRSCKIEVSESEECLLTYKKLQINTQSGTAMVDGKLLVLTSKEYAILKLMLLNPTKLISKSNLFESVWNESYFNEDTTIKVHMSNLRSKIKKLDDSQEYIETVWGMGYKLCR